MKVWHCLSALAFAALAQVAAGQVINIPQSALLPLGDPGTSSWIASDAGLDGTTNLKLIAEVTGTAVANSFLLDVQNDGFPTVGGTTNDVVVFGPAAVPGATATVEIPSTCGISLFHDVYDATGEFLSGPDGILNENPVFGTSDAYLCSDTSKSYTAEGRRQMVKYYPVSPAHSYKFTSQWGTVTQLGSGYRLFLFLDDDHTPNYDYDDMIIGVIAPPCVGNIDCNDNDVCNGEETCLSGVCQEGQPILCDDGDFCNGAETCVNGICGPGTPPTCSDGNVCTVDSCAENACVHAPNNAMCPNDGLFCNGVESCDPVFGCISSGNPCDVGAICDEDDDVCRNCQNDPDCDDGNPCTVGHACIEGVCQPGAPVNCTPFNTQCTIVSCDSHGEPGNCDITTPKPNGTGCDDGLFCTVNDACSAGNCTGTPKDCSALSNECNQGVCNEAADACQAQPLGGETVCNDGDECTVGDACVEGNCQGLVPAGLAQWADLADCMSGPDWIIFPECECHDLNADGRLDLRDAEQFMRLFDGQ